MGVYVGRNFRIFYHENIYFPTQCRRNSPKILILRPTISIEFMMTPDLAVKCVGGV